MSVTKAWRAWACPPLFSPRGFLARAVWIAVAYGLAHAAGLRDATSFLSGTPQPWHGRLWLGLLYAVLHYAFVLAAPILTIGAGIFWGLLHAVAPRNSCR